MHDQSLLLFFRAVSPLHPGSGEGIGYIDRPIQRRSDNQHPKMEGSGLKGVLREAFRKTFPGENNSAGKIQAVFGPESQDDSQKSAVSIQDARILLFPVSSPVGNTVYLTCPLVLEQFKAENQRHPNFAWNYTVPEPQSLETALCDAGTANVDICFQNKLMVQRMAFTPAALPAGLAENLVSSVFGEGEAFFKEFYKKRVVVVHNDLFAYFVKYRTEVVTGNRIDSTTGVVADGALFNHEYLPEGTVLYTWLETGPEKKEKGLSADKVFSFIKEGLSANPYLILGGRTTVGKGQAAVRFKEGIATTTQTP